MSSKKPKNKSKSPTENQLKTLSRKRQSPIDIRDDVALPRRLLPLTLSGHWLKDGEAVLRNTGKQAMIRLGGERLPSILSSGPLNDDYEFHDAHFHWAEENCHGSEHTINSTWFSMEAHVVHWNRKYGSFNECLRYVDGLCVLAYLFVVSDEIRSPVDVKLEKITDNLKYVHKAAAKCKIPANCLGWMQEATQSDCYYYYYGSYNDGDFPECAIWIVFPRAITIRSDQIAEFRKLRGKDGELIKSNVRAINHLGDRRLFKVQGCPS